MPDNALGAFLRLLREKRQLSLRELNRLSGVDHAYIFRLETGLKDSPTDETLLKLLKHLKASKHEATILGYLREHPNVWWELVLEWLKDLTVSVEIFNTAASMNFRGSTRPTPEEMLRRAKLLYEDVPKDG